MYYTDLVFEIIDKGKPFIEAFIVWMLKGAVLYVD